MKTKLITALLLITAAATAGALQSDNSKPIEIAADHFSGDQVSQTAVYTGRVEVHQGTLEMHGLAGLRGTLFDELKASGRRSDRQARHLQAAARQPESEDQRVDAC